jgi:1-acyl-sn-glycerol-3-phosphate acyltransferase
MPADTDDGDTRNTHSATSRANGVHAIGEHRAKRARHTVILHGARAASRLAIALVADFHLDRGAEIPRPAIFIAPHRSMFDIPLGIQAFHRLDVSPLLVVSRSYLKRLRVPEANWDALDLLPISRNSDGRSSLLVAGSEALSAGRSVAIMPEGRIIRDAHDRVHVRSGVADLAVRARAPVVILGSAGSEKFWQRGRPGTFANFARKPVVVLVHDVIQADGDAHSTLERIATGLATAEDRARAYLRSLQPS